MADGVRICRTDDPEADALLAAGWVVVAHSWAAALTAASCDRQRLARLAARAAAVGHLRALTVGDVASILELDAVTAGDYPGGVATAHAPLTAERAVVSTGRRAHGVFDSRGRLVAMTFVDVDGGAAEVDFTVVAREHRRLGLATAVKAGSVLDLLDTGVTVIRTGGSSENVAVLAANTSLGLVVDEEWVTMAPPPVARTSAT